MNRGSYCGVEYGMVELLFDNTHAFLRSKKIHVRLGTMDEVELEEKQEKPSEQEEQEEQEVKMEIKDESGVHNEKKIEEKGESQKTIG